MSHDEGICMASGRSAHFPFCKGEMGAYFLFQPAESPVRLFMVHIRNIDSVSEHQLQPFQLTPVLLSCGHQVDAGGFNAGMAQDVRQLCNVFFHTIKCPGKKLPQIMREHLVRIYFCLHT